MVGQCQFVFKCTTGYQMDRFRLVGCSLCDCKPDDAQILFEVAAYAPLGPVWTSPIFLRVDRIRVSGRNQEEMAIEIREVHIIFNDKKRRFQPNQKQIGKILPSYKVSGGSIQKLFFCSHLQYPPIRLHSDRIFPPICETALFPVVDVHGRFVKRQVWQCLFHQG